MLTDHQCEHASTENDTNSSPSDDSSVFAEGQKTDQEVELASLPVAKSSKGLPFCGGVLALVDHNDENTDVDTSLLESECEGTSPPIVPHHHGVSSSNADEGDAKPSATDLQMNIAETHHHLMTKLMRRVYARLASDAESAPSSGAYQQNKQQESKRQGNKRKRPSGPGQDRDSGRDSRSPSRDEDSNVERSQHQDVKSRSERRLACPFYKSNPWKYCENSTTGKKYKTCGAAPGFEDMHRLK